MGHVHGSVPCRNQRPTRSVQCVPIACVAVSVRDSVAVVRHGDLRRPRPHERAQVCRGQAEEHVRLDGTWYVRGAEARTGAMVSHIPKCRNHPSSKAGPVWRCSVRYLSYL
ncbi:hypothetical protein H257_17515 [Aphanomyces astaci]|uniref:Uncharacterized protein n=1 Tax=Aphanomyces astaci TaxID=112090 RepID=W4FEH0_APHAT|nr:hypothetical protein H257_17515 [Aphanomyces astaci]ETV65875.1 hypothetical protein H257_17515 [Aphanomyces astaci]|eukprot:XP_009844628.1 hypothetical protein H257_17515 [Aphanomyces astaci]